MKKLIFLFIIYLSFTLPVYGDGVDLTGGGDYDFVNAGDISGMDEATGMTLMLWIKSGGTGHPIDKWDEGDNNDKPFMMAVNVTSEPTTFQCAMVDMVLGGNYSAHQADGGSVNSSVNQHLACTWTSQETWTFVVDGADAGDNNWFDGGGAPTNIQTGSEDLRFGTGGDSPYRLDMEGEHWQICMWKDNLPTARITQIANAKMIGICQHIDPTDLVGVWELDDQTAGADIDGDTYLDTSGEGNTATGVDSDNDSDNVGVKTMTYPHMALAGL